MHVLPGRTNCEEARMSLWDFRHQKYILLSGNTACHHSPYITVDLSDKSEWTSCSVIDYALNYFSYATTIHINMMSQYFYTS